MLPRATRAMLDPSIASVARALPAEGQGVSVLHPLCSAPKSIGCNRSCAHTLSWREISGETFGLRGERERERESERVRE